MEINEKPKGKFFLTKKEKQIILKLRLQKYSIKQIANATGRSTTTVKRIIYNW